jgi:signal transduction histidine kinase/tetratricopeptide (TPR) repeat protein
MAHKMERPTLSNWHVHRLVVDDPTMRALQQQRPPDNPRQRATWLTAVAWHLRQRDTLSALAAAAQAEQTLLLLAGNAQALRSSAGLHEPGFESPNSLSSDAPACDLYARLQMVRAEAMWLQGDLSGAQALAQSHCVAPAGNLTASAWPCIKSDANILLSNVAHDVGDVSQAIAHCQLALRFADEAHDGQRHSVAQGLQAVLSISLGASEAEVTWGARMRAMLDTGEAVSELFACQFDGMLDARKRRYADSIAQFSKVSELAGQVGQQRQAIVACVNASASFGNLYDFQSALEWTQRAMDLARPAGWPVPLCMCLSELGGMLKKLNRFSEARTTLDEALGLLRKLPPTTIGSMIQLHSAGLALGQGEPDRALAEFGQLCRRQPPAEPAILLNAQVGCGQSLFALGRAEEAMQILHVAADRAQRTNRPSLQFQALKSLGDASALLAKRSPLHGQEGALEIYEKALQVAASIDGFLVPKELFDAMAGEHARLDHAEQAYAFAVQAMQARKRAEGQAAAQRGIAMATRNEAARLLEEHRALQQEMQASRERAELLQASNVALEHLCGIGREIAAQLDVDAILNSIYSLLQPLVETPRLVIWLVDPESQTLKVRFCVGPGEGAGSGVESMADPDSPLVRCLQGHSDIIEQTPGDSLDGDPARNEQTVLPALFGALRVRGRTLGVLSIGFRDDAVNREQNRRLFRTLCAFSAIALDNSAVHARLYEAHQEMQAFNAAERRAREEAERATHLKNEFLAQVSVTLRRPLDTLHRSLLALQDPGLLMDTQARHACLMTALERSERVNVLARGLLDLARLESGAVEAEIESFSMSDLMQDLFQDFTARANRHGMQVQLHMARELPAAMADLAMTERVLSAFVNFAISRSPPNGLIRLLVREHADEIQVAIEDSGPPVSADQANQHFELRSARALAISSGALDLLMARQMLWLQGRTMRLCDSESRGMRLEFSLQAAPA